MSRTSSPQLSDNLDISYHEVETDDNDFEDPDNDNDDDNLV